VGWKRQTFDMGVQDTNRRGKTQAREKSWGKGGSKRRRKGIWGARSGLEHGQTKSERKNYGRERRAYDTTCSFGQNRRWSSTMRGRHRKRRGGPSLVGTSRQEGGPGAAGRYTRGLGNQTVQKEDQGGISKTNKTVRCVALRRRTNRSSERGSLGATKL